MSQHGAKKLEMTPDIDSSSLQVRVLGFNSSNNAPLKLTVMSDGKEVRFHIIYQYLMSLQCITLSLARTPFQPSAALCEGGKGRGATGFTVQCHHPQDAVVVSNRPIPVRCQIGSLSERCQWHKAEQGEKFMSTSVQCPPSLGALLGNPALE